MKKKKKRVITLLCVGLTIGAIVWVASVAHELKSMITDLNIDYYGDNYKSK
ncbi:hypothetical protein QF028_002327 [Neobacillus sp. B4I6]|uniref:hypothetical protein n=1 Tax=Neobacillus sp. B4I6 TaxID=3373925 RepID=UPI003D215B37